MLNNSFKHFKLSFPKVRFISRIFNIIGKISDVFLYAINPHTIPTFLLPLLLINFFQLLWHLLYSIRIMAYILLILTVNGISFETVPHGVMGGGTIATCLLLFERKLIYRDNIEDWVFWNFHFDQGSHLLSLLNVIIFILIILPTRFCYCFFILGLYGISEKY